MAKDKYAQIAYLEVEETAANTLTIAGLTIFGAALQQNGMMIHRVEYVIGPTTVARLAADTDRVFFGLCGDSSLTTVDLDNPAVYDFRRIIVKDYGVAANAVIYREPMVTDLSGLPGGGKLVPADRIYVFVLGGNLGGVADVQVRVFYTIVELGAADYLELAQSLRVLR